MTRDYIEEQAEKFIRDISEHCDSVRVFITLPEGNDETGAFSVGKGNWYAQMGQIAEWMSRYDELNRIRTRKQDHEEAD